MMESTWKKVFSMTSTYRTTGDEEKVENMFKNIFLSKPKENVKTCLLNDNFLITESTWKKMTFVKSFKTFLNIFVIYRVYVETNFLNSYVKYPVKSYKVYDVMIHHSFFKNKHGILLKNLLSVSLE